MQSLTQPTLLLKPFAESGDKNNLPVTNSDASNPQLADLTNGFPAITSESPDNGGLPPERRDFNALGYLTTTYDYFYQAGGRFTYDATIATAIGGYPLGAALWYTDSNGNTTLLRSTKANNSDNFVTTPSFIGSSWVQELPVLAWDNTWTGNNTFSNAIIGDITGNAGTVTNGVYTTGTQTISGSKTFSGTTTFTGNVNRKGSWTAGTTPSANTSTGVSFVDSTGTSYGSVEKYYSKEGTFNTRLTAKKTDGTGEIVISVGYDASGNARALAPTPDTTTATSSTQIATTGWVNTVGNNVVHLSGTETISGTKTFTAHNNFKQEQSISNTSITKGTNPSSAQYTSLTFCDKNGTGFSANQLGNVQHRLDTDGTSVTSLTAIKNDANSTSTASIGVAHGDDGTTYGFAPTPTGETTSTSSTKIATVAWVNTVGNGVMHLDGTETATGTKTFTAHNKFKEEQTLYNSSLTKGSNPASTTYTSLTFCDKNGTGNSANRLGTVQHKLDTDGKSSVMLSATKNVASATTTGSVGVTCETDGTVYGFSPKPQDTTSTSSTKIATTGWVNTVGNNVAHLSGDETIGGNKTFSNTITGSISGNAGTVTNGVYTNNSQTISGQKTLTKDLIIKNTGIASNATIPTSAQLKQIAVNANDGSNMSLVRSRQETDGRYITDIITKRIINSEEVVAQLGLFIDSTGNSYATAPSPTSSTDKTTKIATTEWVKGACFGIPDLGSRTTVTSPYTPTKAGILRVYQSGGSPTAWISTKVGSTTVWLSRAESTDSSSGSACVWWVVEPNRQYEFGKDAGTLTGLFIPFK